MHNCCSLGSDLDCTPHKDDHVHLRNCRRSWPVLGPTASLPKSPRRPSLRRCRQSRTTAPFCLPHRKMPLLLALAFLAIATPIVHGGGARPYQPTWGSVTTHPNPAWFEGVKFGLYAHFGPYSVPAKFSEWYSHNMYDNGSAVHAYHVKTYGEGFGYKDFIANFTAPRFNATEWAAIYKRSGARYAGPVAEHADGFAMFKSNVSRGRARSRWQQPRSCLCCFAWPHILPLLAKGGS